MSRLSFSLFLISVVVVIFCYTERAEGGKCDPHCFGGCARRGPRKCDRFCGPRGRWRHSRISFKCLPRCGGNCKRCLSPYKCAECRGDYSVKTLSNGNRICYLECDAHCVSGCKKKGAGKCDRRCETNYRLQPLMGFKCAPRCGGNCKTCDEPYKCSACNPGYTILPTNAEGQDLCGACVADCDTCDTNGAGSCDRGGCVAGHVYAPSPYNHCADTCADNCHTCDDNGAESCDPDGCNTGYYYHSSIQDCSGAAPP